MEGRFGRETKRFKILLETKEPFKQVMGGNGFDSSALQTEMDNPTFPEKKKTKGASKCQI